jgi:hypothetical protein
MLKRFFEFAPHFELTTKTTVKRCQRLIVDELIDAAQQQFTPKWMEAQSLPLIIERSERQTKGAHTAQQVGNIVPQQNRRQQIGVEVWRKGGEAEKFQNIGRQIGEHLVCQIGEQLLTPAAQCLDEGAAPFSGEFSKRAGSQLQAQCPPLGAREEGCQFLIRERHTLNSEQLPRLFRRQVQISLTHLDKTTFRAQTR